MGLVVSPNFFSAASPSIPQATSRGKTEPASTKPPAVKKPKTASINVRVPENKAFLVPDKNGNKKYHDPNNGQFTKSPIKQVIEKNTPKISNNRGAGVEDILFSTNTKVDYLDPIELISGNPNYTAGISQHYMASVASAMEMTPNGLNAKLNAGAKANINIAQLATETEYYNAQADVNILSGTANVGVNSTPRGLQAEAGLFAAGLSLEESITTKPKCNGSTCSQWVLSGEAHLGAVGAKGSFGIGELKNGNKETSFGAGAGFGLFGLAAKIKQVTWADPSATGGSSTFVDNPSILSKLG